MQAVFDIAERGWIPDRLVRMGIRSLVGGRIREEEAMRRADSELNAKLLEQIRSSPLAVATEDANAQHYEVPAEFFELMLGKQLKYSCCYWPAGTKTLDAAEEAMLALTCERAELADGMSILELGCGWGSLTLWMAERYPAARITAVSNSHGQRRHIESRCAERGLANVEVLTCDMNDFDAAGTFDRVVSVEMFEHMRNYEQLLRRIASWLEAEGKLFVHLFCHRSFAYFYEPSGPRDWMAREFFTGGTMPSDDLLLAFQGDLTLAEKWRVGGEHYHKTLEAWLVRLDADHDEAVRILAKVYGDHEAERRLQRWRLFVMACSELFGYGEGKEWWVSHYLFERRGLTKV